MMVVPLMLDLMDFRRMMCNISVPIRLLVLVQNGREAMLSLYLQELERVYGWSGRLVVSRHPENIGYSAAVNIGLRLALSLPARGSAFCFVTNSDVMFSPDLLPNLLRDVHEMTRHDAARMDELAAEVANEPSEYSPVLRRGLRVLRSTVKDNRLSTSALLPDRIRYASAKERAKMFSKHYGHFCAYYKGTCFASVMLTRLAISTVGYFDENFYPAYVEDVDYSLRLRLLGFQERNVLYGKFVHRSNYNIRLSEQLELPDALWYRRVKSLMTNQPYVMMKWKGLKACCNGYKEPYNGMVPLDVWVKDEARIQRIRATGMMRSEEFQVLTTTGAFCTLSRRREDDSATNTSFAFLFCFALILKNLHLCLVSYTNNI
ncbi:putative beta galactofuranosyl glycosyltransferase [Trypanosoma cruzi]|uniref:Putative beta galactofuranosyl glycosyltransferase n=1 Tax=Trypanosoma cruzi TaxID=5693 RepID=A0A2V2UKY8_TRYCR|nr:putative beta galactofuranosyl glycosyltransferase [Trypanosoma cruzi]